MVAFKSRDEVKDFVKNNAMPLSLQAIGLVVLILNLWLASKLSPLAEGITQLNQKVYAIENRNEKADILIERFIKVEEKINNIGERVLRIENKLDKISEVL